MTELDRAMEYVLPEPNSGCWLWMGGQGGGYGRIRFEGRMVQAHRMIYEQIRGLVPLGMTMDHLCRNQVCVNPDHLEAVTNRVNVLRGKGLTAANVRRNHCVNGHGFSPSNTRLEPKNKTGFRRVCLTCQRERQRHYYWQRIKKRADTERGRDA